MEKTDKRVSKRLIIASMLTALLAVPSNLASSEIPVKDSVSVKPIYNVMAFDSDRYLTMMQERLEPKIEVVEVKPEIKEVKPEVKWMDFKMTHYVATCKGCSGVTRAEINVKNITEYHGYKILSVDTKIIPLGSIVEIQDGDDVFEAIAIDTGGAIKGRKLDLLVGNVKEAYKLGVKQVKVRVVREGWLDEEKKL